MMSGFKFPVMFEFLEKLIVISLIFLSTWGTFLSIENDAATQCSVIRIDGINSMDMCKNAKKSRDLTKHVFLDLILRSVLSSDGDERACERTYV
jgi:hypothetical protein